MTSSTQHGAFAMPMFNSFVPSSIRPWIYLLFAFTFQLSGGVYLGSLNHMIGSTALMREDLLMCMYANLAGMAIYFPLLFRMKFRFTNKTLLTSAATGVLLCNLFAPHITFLPLLWLVCFIEGICKIQGTFECMSNIQLWLTPKRDFTIFFPVLHIVILCSIQLSDLLTVYLAHYFSWEFMHWFICGIMIIDLLVLRTCICHFRFMRKFPLFGIDWLGGALWAAFSLQVAFIFDYGDWYDWWNSPIIRQVTFTSLATLIIAVWRMHTIRHPFLEPAMWKYKRLLPLLLLITLVEGFLATEHVLEEVFYEEVMHYHETVFVQLNWWAIVGILGGCGFSFWWMHLQKLNYIKLILVGFGILICYLMGYYFIISSDIHLSQLYPIVFCRGFAYSILSIVFITSLQQLMSFPHFFQSLGVFNMLHMVVGGVLGAAIYTQGLSYYIPDNLSRYGSYVDNVSFSRSPFPFNEYMEEFILQMMEISIKQIYGWVIYGCIFLFLLLLIWDAPIRRQHLKKIPNWKDVGREVKNSYWRVRNKQIK
ncbi:MAG: hypothetical protein E7099_02355 [Mediterranea massiliensis]|nr:hypothetical protein [Mediterranea massiliensis]